jgi:L-asparagine transporter-like permease
LSESLSVLFEKIAFEPLYKAGLGKTETHVIAIISTIGTGIFLQNAAMLV